MLVHAGDSSLYASLRVDVRETLLVLANLSDHAIPTADLSLIQGSLPPGQYSLSPLLGTIKFPDLKTDTKGKFSGFQPSNAIPAYGMYVLQLKSVK
jgi:hypothetical protein